MNEDADESTGVEATPEGDSHEETTPDDDVDEPVDPDRDVDEPVNADDTDSGRDTAGGGRDPRQYALWAAFGIATLLAVIAALRLYLSVDQLVSIWIAPEYEPAFSAAFNLVVLLLAGYAAFALADRVGG